MNSLSIKITTGMFAGIIGVIAIFGSFFVVREGHIGIQTRFAKAVEQYEPGLHFKIPLIDSVKSIEVRERKNVEDLAASTANQLPMTATVSINWTVKTEEALSLYVRYGSLDQFEARILDPKLRQASKAALATFRADELIRNRNSAIAAIQENMVTLMEEYPVVVHSPQIENISLPDRYLEAIQQKEEAREAAVREQHNLERQKLEAAREIQTAEADRDAVKARADGHAYKIKIEAQANAQAILIQGEAEADKIALINKSLAENPLLIEYEKAKRWSGVLPTTMLPNGATPFINLNK